MIETLFKLFKLPELVFLEFVRFFRETLQGTDKRYSSRNTMIAQSFLLCALGFIYETYKTQHVNIQMFESFLYIAFGTSVVTSASNIINKKIDSPSNEQKMDVQNTVIMTKLDEI